MTEMDRILHDFHAEAEREYANRGWQEGQHGAWIHSYTATRAVTELVKCQRRLKELEGARSV